MSDKPIQELRERVERAANAVLEATGTVGPLELLLQMGWLAPSRLRSWQKGITASLVDFMQASPEKRGKAFRYFEQWAHNRGLKPVEVPYVRSTPGGEILLRVTKGNDPAAEEFFHRHYIPGDLPARKTERTVARLSKPPDIVVFQTARESVICTECKTELFKGDFLFMEKGQPLCLTCADLDELEFLPSGRAALTRRARQHSRLSAIVVRFARARRRYERQGILVEPEAIEEAERECLSDEEQRMARREREATRRAAQDEALVAEMTQSIRRMYPGCPAEEAEKIARHTAERGSGRVGRSAAGQALEERALELAVAARIRHRRTEYDELLGGGCERFDARAMVRDKVREVLDRWKGE
jgi:hypothetical protein